MKVLALIVLIGVLFPISTLSLSCYTCTSAQEKKCKEGKLDDKYVTPCDLTNSVNPETMLPLNATEIAALANNKQIPEIMGCIKAQGSAGGDDGTVKGCMISPYPDKKDACTSETVEGASGTLCVCHSDKCNGADNIASRFSIIVAMAVAICLAAVK